MKRIREIASKFTRAAQKPEPVQDERPLRNILRHSFGGDLDRTVARMKEVLENMGLPLPKQGAVIHGAEGALMFLDQYGIILRLELTDDLLMAGQRINDHPFVLQPLGQRQITDYAVLEICPGVNVTKDKNVAKILAKNLHESGVRIWDDQLCNMGVMPVRLPQFPEGVPVVIDRLAVEMLTKNTAPVKSALKVAGLKHDPQSVYDWLKRDFTSAWPQGQSNPDKEKFAVFLQSCLRHKALGHLVSGWMRDPNAGPNDWMYEDTKRGMAADAGHVYAGQIKAMKQPTK